MKKALPVFLLLISLTACSANAMLSEYRPMIFVNQNLYGISSGNTINMLDEEWELVGCIEKIVSQYEPMVMEEFTSNTLKVGDEIYINEGHPDHIFVKQEGADSYTRFDVIEN